MPIKYVEGDLFEHVPAKLETDKPVFICHVCNDKGGWGSGFVVPLGKIYPVAKESYLATGVYTQGCVQPILVDTISNIDIYVMNMIAQTLGGVRPLNYYSLAACMEKVGDLAKNCKASIHAPMFGAGLAGGNWNFIIKLIEDCWLSKDIPVTIYYLPQYLPNNWVPPGHSLPVETRIELSLTTEEIAALEDLSKRQELSKEKVLIQGLRLYQQHILGVPEMPSKLGDINAIPE